MNCNNLNHIKVNRVKWVNNAKGEGGHFWSPDKRACININGDFIRVLVPDESRHTRVVIGFLSNDEGLRCAKYYVSTDEFIATHHGS